MSHKGSKSKQHKKSVSNNSNNNAVSTAATAQLEAANIKFTVYFYEHSSDHMDKGYGLEAAAQINKNPDQIFKTLLADTGDEIITAIVPVSGHLSLKGLACAVGVKKAQMAEPKTAMRVTGYVVGGISPFGQRLKHRTVLDESALMFDEILVSGGKRGMSLGVRPVDLVEVLNAVTADIATW